jgi:hypothetical protein
VNIGKTEMKSHDPLDMLAQHYRAQDDLVGPPNLGRAPYSAPKQHAGLKLALTFAAGVGFALLITGTVRPAVNPGPSFVEARYLAQIERGLPPREGPVAPIMLDHRRSEVMRRSRWA